MKVSASFLKIQNEEDKILTLDKYADYMHYDVMDGNFTESKTPSLTHLKLNKPKDVHLMVMNLKYYIDLYSALEPLFITFHVEATNDVLETINYIKSKGIKVGLAFNPATPVDIVIPYLDEVDLVLVMSVVPGKGGQPFIDVTDKIKELISYRKKNNLNFLIEVDGGINDKTIDKVKNVDIVVSGSYITDSGDYSGKIQSLKALFQKGFTLAELMGVIVVLSIIAIVTTITVDRSIKNSRYETCMTQETNLIEGAKMWAIDNASSLPGANASRTLPISTLRNGGYIESDLKSPMTNALYSSGTKVTITSSNGSDYTYTVTYGTSSEKCQK